MIADFPVLNIISRALVFSKMLWRKEPKDTARVAKKALVRFAPAKVKICLDTQIILNEVREKGIRYGLHSLKPKIYVGSLSGSRLAKCERCLDVWRG